MNELRDIPTKVMLNIINDKKAITSKMVPIR
jgi:hypothetical protein